MENVDSAVLSVLDIPAAPPCTPSPQPGDRDFAGQDSDQGTPSWTRTAVSAAPDGAAQTQLPQMAAPTTPQYYAAQYLQYPAMAPNSAPAPYGQTVMYVPMHVYQQQNMRQQNAGQEYPNQQSAQGYQQASHQHHQPGFSHPSSHRSRKPDAPSGPKTPSRQRVIWNFCQFCHNNREPEDYYTRHTLRDANGNVTCPVLRAYNCPICNNGGGDKAHTKSYCPQLRYGKPFTRRSVLF